MTIQTSGEVGWRSRVRIAVKPATPEVRKLPRVGDQTGCHATAQIWREAE